MATYTAAAKRNPGRASWLVEFRHPLRMDAGDRPGKKTRKGLGTNDEARAQLLVEQLNQILANEALWSLGARSEAEKLYDPAVVEIFYSEIEPRTADARPLRDKLLPFPTRDDGYAKVMLLGVPGAGKTTLIRQLIGTHPKLEAFPSTSLNRTTTFPTEIVLQPGRYEAVVTFLSEHEARFEIEECISAAIIDAVGGDRNATARTLLEKSDMRFRLKYVLGDLGADDADEDPYADDETEESDDEGDTSVVSDAERPWNEMRVRGYIDHVMNLAQNSKKAIELEQGPLDQMTATDKAAALDLIEELADGSQEFAELVSDILDEFRDKFAKLEGAGHYEKSNTGWPRAWRIKLKPSEDRRTMILALRPFSGITQRSWGKLLTPLVNGMRVQGPFRAAWAHSEPRLILIDTEGLGHKANATADLPEQTAALLAEADVILLVDSAKSGLTNYAAGKALESIANTGATKKLSLVFTHMDLASAAGLKGQRLQNQLFSGLRNVVDNQLAKSVSAEAGRFLVESLDSRTFYLGRMDKYDAKGAGPALNQLLDHLMAEQPAVVRPAALPDYNPAFLMLAVQEAARDFRSQWQGLLNIAPNAMFKPSPWQTIKALTRRYAENWGETYELRPTANLRTALETAVARYLEAPLAWQGNPTSEEKRDMIEQLKSAVAAKLPEIARRRLRESPQPAWHEAWAPRGAGSTITRRIRIEGIYERWVPIPDARGDQAVLDFVQEVENAVEAARAELLSATASP